MRGLSVLTASVVLVAVVTVGLSGVAAMLRFPPIRPGMARAGVPESWLVFPIGVSKAAGAAGLGLGLAGVPLVGPAAASGLVLFFVCALAAHVRVRDFSPQFGLAAGFLGLSAATLVLLLLHP